MGLKQPRSPSPPPPPGPPLAFPSYVPTMAPASPIDDDNEINMILHEAAAGGGMIGLANRALPPMPHAPHPLHLPQMHSLPGLPNLPHMAHMGHVPHHHIQALPPPPLSRKEVGEIRRHNLNVRAQIYKAVRRPGKGNSITSLCIMLKYNPPYL